MCLLFPESQYIFPAANRRPALPFVGAIFHRCVECTPHTPNDDLPVPVFVDHTKRLKNMKVRLSKSFSIWKSPTKSNHYIILHSRSIPETLVENNANPKQKTTPARRVHWEAARGQPPFQHSSTSSESEQIGGRMLALGSSGQCPPQQHCRRE